MLQQSILCFNTSTIKCRAYRIVSTTLIQVGKAPYRIVSTTLIQVAHTHYRIVSQGFPIKSRAREHFSVLKPPRENILRQARVHPFYSGNSNRDLLATFFRFGLDKSTGTVNRVRMVRYMGTQVRHLGTQVRYWVPYPCNVPTVPTIRTQLATDLATDL